MVSTSGKDRIQIVIPKFYHDDLKRYGLLGKVVLVEVTELTNSVADSEFADNPLAGI
jgi:hypothetical protein